MFKRGSEPDSNEPDHGGPGSGSGNIGPYRILRELARGGMGVVFVAEDQRLGRRVALKTLGARSPGARDRLWREARAAAALNHPGICQVYDVEEVDDELWIAMELLEGDGLDVTLAQERLGVDRAVRIGLEILGPLGFLHDRGLVHRDLKPSNIFLTPVGLKLLDFGLTRGFDAALDEDSSDPQLTQTGAILGTPRYMAPEQWRARDVGPGTDLFAWGAILYEMLSGRYAFDGDDPIDIFHACAKEQPPPLTGTPRIEAVYQVVRKAIAKDPAERYASTGELAEALRTARDRAPADRTTRSRRQAAELEPATVQRFIALPFRVLRPDPDTDFLATSLPEAIGTSLSGLQHLSVRSSQLGAGHDARLDLRRLAADAEVDYALSGTLMSAGPKVRVNAQLLRVPSGTVVWSLQEEAPADDLFQLHDDLTRRIVDGVQVPLSPDEESRLERDTPVNARAFELYLRGVHRAREVRTQAELLALRDLLAEAVRCDSSYAPAWAMYGRTCRVIAKYFPDEPMREHLDRAKHAFERAFEADPDSPIAHNLFTYYQLEELGDSLGAMLRLLDRVGRGSSDANLWAGLVPACRFLRLHQASLAAHERAVALDPRIPTGVHLTQLQMADYQPVAEGADSPALKAAALAAMGREAEALAFLESDLDGEFEGVEQIFTGAIRAALLDDVNECRQRIHQVMGDGMRDPEGTYFFARLAGRVGLTQLGLGLLEQTVERGFHAVAPSGIDPWIDSLRGERGFAKLAAKAEAGRRAAREAFIRAGGEAVLGTRTVPAG